MGDVLTVSELIMGLHALPQDRPVVIEDADTNWVGKVIHITVCEDAIVLSIKYSEIDSEYSPGKVLEVIR